MIATAERPNPPSRRITLLLLPMLSMLAGTGCTDSFLITPVRTNKALEESVLQRDSIWTNEKIALIDVSGIIMNGTQSPLFGSGENPVARFKEQLDFARKDNSVKGVILRINSPGGGVVASEIMHQELTAFREKTDKPVVAVMMDVAASGGYYLACGCDEIVAHPSTVTGSIGVIMQMFDLTGTMEMIGVTSDAITSGPNKDAGSPFRSMDPDERAIFQSIVLDMYERFLDVVKKGRPGLDDAKIRRLADGRIYSASQAMENGLIDKIGNMRDTIESMKERIGAEDVTLVTYRRPYGFAPNYYAAAPQSPLHGNGAPTTQINMLHLDAQQLGLGRTPQFMYLWSPGK